MSIAKKPVKYCVVDAFTESAFNGNPAAVCFLEEERDDASSVKLRGHATLAAAHTLFSSGLVDSNVIEFLSLSGILTAKKIPAISISNFQNGEADDGFYIELDFPVDPIKDSNIDETPEISEALNGATVIDVKRIEIGGDLLVELRSGRDVTEVEPQLEAIVKCPGRGIIVSGIGDPGSGYDFYSRFFCPKIGIPEDPVCGSAHCGLASSWSKKLKKCDFNAYQASPRGGVLNIHSS